MDNASCHHETSLLEKLRQQLVVVDPTTDAEAKGKMKLIIENRSEFPSKLRPSILAAASGKGEEHCGSPEPETRTEADIFLSEVYGAVKVLFLGRFNHTKTKWSEEWHGLDRGIDTEDEAELAIRLFPNVLAEELQPSSQSYLSKANPISLLTSYSNAVSFVPLFAELGTELGTGAGRSGTPTSNQNHMWKRNHKRKWKRNECKLVDDGDNDGDDDSDNDGDDDGDDDSDDDNGDADCDDDGDGCDARNNSRNHVFEENILRQLFINRTKESERIEVNPSEDLDNESLEVLKRLRDTGWVTPQDEGKLVDWLLWLTETSYLEIRFIETRLRLLMEWNPSYLMSYDGHGIPLYKFPFARRYDAGNVRKMLAITFELGMSRFPNELGFLFHEHKDSPGTGPTSYFQYYARNEWFGTEWFVEMFYDTLAALAPGQSSHNTVRALVFAAATHDKVPLDVLYNLTRYDPSHGCWNPHRAIQTSHL